MYKVKNSLAPEHISDTFYKQFKSCNLRGSDFPIPTFNTVNYGKHSIRHQDPISGKKWTKTFATKQAFVNLKKHFGQSVYHMCWMKDVAVMHAQYNRSTIDFK